MNPDERNFVTAQSMQMMAEVVLYESGHIKGVLHNKYLEAPFEFLSFVQMIERMEKVFDSMKFPQAFMKPRKFDNVNNKRATKKLKAERNDIMQTAVITDTHEEAVSSKCTFEITVKSRQNATWQGQILWAEKNTKQSFRSVLEMLKLMDEALHGNTEQAQTDVE